MAQPTSPKLPEGFSTVREILGGKASRGSIVSVMGIVSGFRPPVATRGTGERRPSGGASQEHRWADAVHADWKCVIELYDFSVEHDLEQSLELSIFRPEAEMPQVGCGDVIVVSQAKVGCPFPPQPPPGGRTPRH